MATSLRNVVGEIEKIPEYTLYGRVSAVLGMLIETGGAQRGVPIGDRCHVLTRQGKRVACEVVGFKNDRALAMPFGSVDGIGIGCRVDVAEAAPAVYPSDAWLGRVINAMGEPVDGKGPLPEGPIAYPLRCAPPPAHRRRRLGAKLDLGVRAINTFLTTCQGQRMGIFAGSGVGKSILMSMMARYTASDVTVIGLVGERGREVQEFITDDLGAEGLARSVVIVATGDEPPLQRRQAAYLTLSVAESGRTRPTTTTSA